MSDPLEDPRVRFEVARRLGREHVRRAEAIVGAMQRLRFRARRQVDLAREMMAIAESAAIEVAVTMGEEREIEREGWARASGTGE